MIKYLLIYLYIGFCFNPLTAQSNFELNGIVVDENNVALLGASVALTSLNKGTLTDTNGKFSIPNLKSGNYLIEVSYVGFNSYKDSVFIGNNQTHKIQLSVAHLNLHEVKITDNYVQERIKDESLNIEIVNNEYLKQFLGGSLMTSLKRLPGISTIDIGSGQSKPVIRGLGFNRVVVVENNVKHQAQQWGFDHGLEIDQYAVEDIEVIKGPASLTYGSDAIGGVINIKKRKLPTNNTIGGSIDLTSKTNNNLYGTSLSVYGRRNWFFANFRATYIDYADYKVPTDSINIYSYKAALQKNYLRNTAGNERNLHLTMGIVKNKFQSKFYISSIYSKSGFFANAHGLEPQNIDAALHDKSNRDINQPFQEANHFKISNSTFYQWNNLKLDIDLGFQHNFRQEFSRYTAHGHMPPVFPDNLNFKSELEREFDKYTYSSNFKLSGSFNKKSKFALGGNSELQNNDINGRGFIIPEFKQLTFGFFSFVKHKFSEISGIQLGVRYDYGHIKTSEYFDWFKSPVGNNLDNTVTKENLQRAKNLDLNFSNYSWSVGYNYNPEHWTFKVNVGKGFRIPTPKELAANGVNYHRFSYEVGKPDLSNEISYQFDTGLEYHSKTFAVGITPFANYFTNYIYLNPTGDRDILYGIGNQVFNYSESEIFRYGSEIHSHIELMDFLQLGVIGEYVYSEQLSGKKKGFTLPFSPPPSAIFNIKISKAKLSFMQNAYLSADYKITGSQKNIVPPEEKTNGYQTISLSFGGNIHYKKQIINISMQLQNLFDVKYLNHTSFYRLLNVPEAGRNFIVNISIPFSGRIKH